MIKLMIDWATLDISEKKNKIQYICTGCGAILDELIDFLVHSIKHNVTLCRDCYDLPEWYELVNR